MKRCKKSKQERFLSLVLVMLLALALTPTGAFALPDELTEITKEALSGDIWDGTTIDISWYNTTDTYFEVSSAEQLAGLAAITTPKRGLFDEVVVPDLNGKVEFPSQAGDDIYFDNFAGKTVKLTTDIDLDGKRWYPISDLNVYSETAGGQGASISGTFSQVSWQGIFDGGGHVICGLFVTGNDPLLTNNFGGYQGFFSAVGEGGVIKNLGIQGTLYGRVVGGIAAISNPNGLSNSASPSAWPLIMNCWADVQITGNGSGSRFAGGIFGGEDSYRAVCHVINCYVKGSVSNGQSAGGVVGVTLGYVTGCYNLAQIPSNLNHGSVVGTIYLSSSSNASNKAAGVYSNNYALSGTASNLYRYKDDITGFSANPIAVTSGFSTPAVLRAVETLTGLGSAYVADTYTINDGYPILFWQADDFDGDFSTTDISSASISTISVAQYTGQPIEPAVSVDLGGATLIEGCDYYVVFEDNTDPGSATVRAYGLGRYSGQAIPASFMIEGIDLGDAIISKVKPQWFYGDAIEPVIKVTDIDKNLLVEGTDYTISYRDNTAAGVGELTIDAIIGGGTYGSQTITFSIVAASDSLEGSGTAENPFKIASKEDLQFVSHAVNTGLDEGYYANAYYVVTEDIDATKRDEDDADLEPIGIRQSLNNNPVSGGAYKPFAGTFDGAGHSITLGMTFDSIDNPGFQHTATSGMAQSVALFGYVGMDGTSTTIKNITLKGSVEAPGGAGLIGAVYQGNLLVENCHNQADITATASTSYAGGLIAQKFSGNNISVRMVDCSNSGAITCTSAVSTSAGGLVATVGAVNIAGSGGFSIESSFNTGTINGSSVAGGLIGTLMHSGYNAGASLKNCYNTGDVTAAGSASGGLIGSTTGSSTANPAIALSIDNCFNTGAVTSKGGSAGGVLGSFGGGTGLNIDFTNLYNTGAVTGYGDATAISSARGAGGILGTTTNNGAATINFINVYNTGVIKLSANVNPGFNGAGQILGYAARSKTFNLSETAFCRSEGGTSAIGFRYIGTGTIANFVNDNSVALTDAEMKTTGSSGFASRLGSAFKDDVNSLINEGYPVLIWQEGSTGPKVGEPGSGDLDGDGIVTMGEALIVMRLVAGLSISLTPAQLAAADFNLDGAVTMTDVLLIMRKAAEL